MCLDVRFSIDSDFLLLPCDLTANAVEGGSAHTDCIATSVLKAASASIHFCMWICLGSGGIPSFWIAGVSLLLSRSSQKRSLHVGVHHEVRVLLKHRMINKCTALEQTTLCYISADLCSLGNKYPIRFLCLLSCFTLNYDTFELSALVESSRRFCLQLKSSSGSEQGLAGCVQRADNWGHCPCWYKS